jgi:hypothetical protein
MISTNSRRWKNRKQRGRKLLVQHLENRQMLAAEVFVNDNWEIVDDVDDSGTLTQGDIVDNSLDVGAAAVTGEFGVDAFADINAAVAAVDDGDTVVVLEGEYDAEVMVDKSITLEGANAGISAGVDAGERSAESIINGGITVSADDVTIDGFTINGGADIGGDTAGIYLAAGAEDVTISNNILVGEDAGRGILTTFNGENDGLLVENNEISNWTSGVFNQTNTDAEIVGNFIHDNVAGVANDMVEDVLIEGNDFKDNEEAIGSLESVDLVVIGNDLAENTIAVANYGGEAIEAVENFFGTVDEDEILDMITGDVLTDDPLAESPFDVVDLPDLVFSGEDGVMLTVNPNTGAFEFTDGADLVITGTGAKLLPNGKLIIHTHDELGRKIDVKGTADGSLDVSIKQLGKGVKKMNFDLTADTEE